MAEEAKKQDNIESITTKALPQVDQNAKPENMEDDWITNFFDKCRLISDDEMQNLWSRVLAGEANSPESYSKRTVNFLSSLDKSDAVLFQALCGFGWVIDNVVPLLYDNDAEIYNSHGTRFDSLKHLDEIGLLSFNSLAGFRRLRLPKEFNVVYYGKVAHIKFEKEEVNSLELGDVLLSKIGQELASICASTPVPDFFDYVIKRWKNKGMAISIPSDESENQELVDTSLSE